MIGVYNNSIAYGIGGGYYGYGNAAGSSSEAAGISGLTGEDKENDGIKQVGEGDGPNGECETCKRRKYKDGSDEMVSFKSAAHIDPAASGSVVRGHEQEHVSNAYKKAEKGNGQVINASVSLKTAICPECGRSYVSGGTTNTQIRYTNEENPYQKSLKSQDRTKYEGMNVDLTA